MNKELLILIKGLKKEARQAFLEQADPKTLSCDNIVPGLISVKDHSKSNIILIAEGFRQMVLSRMPGCAATRIRMEYKGESDKGKTPSVPVLHKYAYIPGVVENVREIISNLQKGVFRLPENERTLTLSCEFSSDIPVSSHYKEFLLGSFFDEDQAKVIINPEQNILTFQDTGHHVRIELTIEKGVGFRSAKDVKRDEIKKTHGNPDVLALALDADFNPVIKAGYRIQKEMLQFDIETNGAITPLEAYETAYGHFSKELMQSEGLDEAATRQAKTPHIDLNVVTSSLLAKRSRLYCSYLL